MRNREKKRLTVSALILAVLLLIGTVYAASSEVLIINGKVSLGTNVDCIIVPETDLDKSGDVENKVNTWGILEVSADGKSATVSGRIAAPGERIRLYYTVKNQGTTSAKVEVALTGPTSTNYTGTETPLIIGGSYITGLNDKVIAAGASSNVVELTLTWNNAGGVSDSGAAGADFEFRIDMTCSVTTVAPNFTSITLP